MGGMKLLPVHRPKSGKQTWRGLHERKRLEGKDMQKNERGIKVLSTLL